MQFGASLQAYPGGGNIRWGAFQEGINVRRYSNDVDPNVLLGTYSEQLYGQPGHCVAPCVLGERFVPDTMSVLGASTSGYRAPMVPLASAVSGPAVGAPRRRRLLRPWVRRRAVARRPGSGRFDVL